MTELMLSPPHLPSSSSSISSTRIRGEEEEDQVSVLAVLVTVFRKSLVGCSGTSSGAEKKHLMEIGWPTNVKHVAHVTFDRFDGFLGLPVEFEPEVPRRPPSASTRVFGVSTESMQLEFDSRGNCVPAILLMMQRRLYSQGGLKMEGIFRINPENSREEYVREQLNNGVIPDDIDVHCLAGLIKAWFRELPTGVLDSLSTEHVMQARSEDEYTQLVRQLPPTEAALLDWSINLMSDVATMEHLNKMNARNIAMVFAPNMTQMSDPLTALMYAVQVMNFLKILILKTLRERKDYSVEIGPTPQLEPSDEGFHNIMQRPKDLDTGEPPSNHTISLCSQVDSKNGNGPHKFLSSIENILPAEGGLNFLEGVEVHRSSSNPNGIRKQSRNSIQGRVFVLKRSYV
ncbi:rho GTPase-activating protein 5-like [Dorcoceras hygrometricum]|uniref:Rho GTPase-activating protein 5-like n=1 Tax=Dorcoceras hygrometricum TaxID=472368 RepID=A0A2Z7BBQ1_9LAMI|nr:rho GTPase-activating protein 5-like [Dorcoceras hygrometricum]